MSTKLSNGSISQVSAATSFKAAVGSQAASSYGTVLGAVLSGATAQGSQNLAHALGIGNSGTGSFIGTFNFGALIPGAGSINFGTGNSK